MADPQVRVIYGRRSCPVMLQDCDTRCDTAFQKRSWLPYWWYGALSIHKLAWQTNVLQKISTMSRYEYKV